MKDYLPYLVGALAGMLIAILLSSLLMLTGTPQLILFALLPVVGGHRAHLAEQALLQTLAHHVDVRQEACPHGFHGEDARATGGCTSPSTTTPSTCTTCSRSPGW